MKTSATSYFTRPVLQEGEIKKVQEVLGGKFDKNNYTSRRIWAETKDRKKVAISLVYKKHSPSNGSVNELHTPFLLLNDVLCGISIRTRTYAVKHG